MRPTRLTTSLIALLLAFGASAQTIYFSTLGDSYMAGTGCTNYIYQDLTNTWWKPPQWQHVYDGGTGGFKYSDMQNRLTNNSGQYSNKLVLLDGWQNDSGDPDVDTAGGMERIWAGYSNVAATATSYGAKVVYWLPDGRNASGAHTNACYYLITNVLRHPEIFWKVIDLRTVLPRSEVDNPLFYDQASNDPRNPTAPTASSNFRSSGHYSDAGQLKIASNIVATVSAAMFNGQSPISYPVALPKSAEYSHFITYRPGDGATVFQNPPVFSWRYSPKPSWSGGVGGYWENASTGDLTVWTFQFQANTSQDWTSPVVNVRTPLNFYNALYPFSGGSTIYWRVGYINPDGTTNQWSDVRSFTISVAAETWNRGMLASNAWLTSTLAHPHIGFSSANYAAVSNWLWFTNSGTTFFDARVQASNTVADAAFWNLSSTTNWGDPNKVNEWARYFGNVLLSAKFTAGTNFWNASPTPEASLEQLAIWTMTNDYGGMLHYRKDDAAMMPDQYVVLALGYDWLFDRLSWQQKSNCLRAINLKLAGTFGGGNAVLWAEPSNQTAWNADPLGYSGGWNIPASMVSKVGGSHPAGMVRTASLLSSSAWLESTNAQGMFTILANYAASDAINLYGQMGYMSSGLHYGDALLTLVMSPLHNLSITLREAQLWKTPFWQSNLLHAQFSQPLGFLVNNNPFGDSSALWNKNTPSWLDSAGLAGSGTAWKYLDGYSKWKSQDGRTYEDLFIPFYYTTPTSQTNTNLSLFLPEGGYVAASSVPVNAWPGGFSNGVGFAVSAKPQGAGMNHQQFSDGNAAMWAYGQQITDTGDGFTKFGMMSMSRNVVLVNGWGQSPVAYGDIDPWVARVTRFTNGSDFTYAAMDLTKSYPVTNRSGLLGGQSLFAAYNDLYKVGPATNLTKMVRHLLFPHRSYFVIFDEMTSTNAAQFQWSWQVPFIWRNSSESEAPGTGESKMKTDAGWQQVKETLVTNAAAFSYTVGGTYPNQGGFTPLTTNHIPVVVRHIYRTNDLTLIKRSHRNTSRVWAWTGETNATATNETFSSDIYTNIWTTEDYSAPSMHNDYPKAHTVYLQSPYATNWNFFTIVFPVPPGSTNPVITALSDLSAEIRHGDTVDVVSFDPADSNSVTATYWVDVDATADVTIQDRTASPTFSPAGPTVDALPTNITISAESGAATFYKIGSGSYAPYSTPVSINSGDTLYAYATNAGKLDSYVASTAYSTNSPAVPDTVATPVFSPAAGTFSNTVTVTISTATSGASIHSTTNGTATTNSTVQSSWTLTNSATISAIASKAGWIASAVTNASYVVTNAPVVPPSPSTNAAGMSVLELHLR